MANFKLVMMDMSQTNSKFGLFLRSSADGSVVISKISPDGACAKTDLQPGMVLAEINGTKIENMTPKQAARVLNLASSPVTIKTLKPNLPRNKTAAGNMVNSKFVTVDRSQTNSEFGLFLRSSANESVVISKISPFGACAKTDLQPGMVLAEINGRKIENMTPKQAARVLNLASSPVTIKAIHPSTVGRYSQRPAPPGCPEGGIWINQLYHGPTTVISMVVCCLLFGPVGFLVGTLIPCDERNVYKVNGSLYALDGSFLRQAHKK